MEKTEMYKYPMSLTQQFRHCGNPLRIDTYKGCSFGCKYCFANNRGGNSSFQSLVADMSIIYNLFNKAFENNKETKNILVEMLRHKVPLHLGGMSDPLQEREWKDRATYELLRISKQYNYPIMISTKQCFMPDEYWKILDPNIHAFQISLFTDDVDLMRQFEANTPTPSERIAFIKELHQRGFWVGVRMQPLVDISSALSLTEKLNGYVNYITVEHLKICNDNRKRAEELFELSSYSLDDYKCTGRNYELKTEIKKANIEQIKARAACPIGCGDNDLHEFSDSNCCCGIDTINDNFNNWVQYNSMNIRKTNRNDYWYPKCNCSSVFNSECRIKGLDFKGYVDNYMEIGMVDKKCNFK